jgi:hypothetical protein
MTDRLACAALSVGSSLVSVEALTELATLVNILRSAHDRVTDLPQEDPRDCPDTVRRHGRPDLTLHERILPFPFQPPTYHWLPRRLCGRAQWSGTAIAPLNMAFDRR